MARDLFQFGGVNRQGRRWMVLLAMVAIVAVLLHWFNHLAIRAG